MGESDSYASSVSTRSCARRIFLGIALVLLLFLSLGVGWWCYLWAQAANRLASAIAKLDREDPGWRWDDLQAKRAVIPDGENAALQLEAAFRLLPGGWPTRPVHQDGESQDKSIVEQILEREPITQLDETQIKELRLELEKVRPALVEGRKLVRFAKGRYPAVAPEYIFSRGPLPYEQHPRPVAKLLSADTVLLAEDQKPEAALDSCRAIINTGRALGDDPLSISHLVRIACRHLALVSIERVLAQGQPSEDAMRATQKLLEDEEQQPLLLYALRGERAFQHELMGWMETGDLGRISPGAAPSSSRLAGMYFKLAAAWLRENHARQLEMMREAVDVARLPPDEQTDKLHDWHTKLKAEAQTPQGSNQLFVSQALIGVVKIADACVRSRAELRCAIAALAIERYRLAHHCWPESLEQLVPEFLNQVPLDPYDRKPLRYVRLEDGVAIYSVGPDGTDNGGKLDRKNYVAPGTDMVFRLWNASLRGKPRIKAAPIAPN